MGKYDAVAARTLAAIAKKGGIVTFPDFGTPATYNPVDDTFSGGSVAGATGRAVQIESEPDQLSALGLTIINPVTLLIAAKGLSVTPVPGVRFTWANVTYTTKFADPTAPDGVTPIMYMVIGSVG